MDETTSKVIDKITVRADKPMRLPNGEHSTIFYDCMQLTPNDLARLAAESVGERSEDAFDIAVGIAFSGIFFAAAVAGGRRVGILEADGTLHGPPIDGLRVVLVDDVVHSGKRMTRALDSVLDLGGIVVGIACIVRRTGITDSSSQAGAFPCPLWSALEV